MLYISFLNWVLNYLSVVHRIEYAWFVRGMLLLVSLPNLLTYFYSNKRRCSQNRTVLCFAVSESSFSCMIQCEARMSRAWCCLSGHFNLIQFYNQSKN